eukprot:TRINITY_DN92928_c0_g1_i1.p1 TRINITY_DN92928_c0_g1~~TRINITY_DN92928_c0_g1_i1.p1  ORF type:complete len:690 (+),score=117.94 TRINITY_DN92928_c0_g1_i1:119-2071(+)
MRGSPQQRERLGARSASAGRSRAAAGTEISAVRSQSTTLLSSDRPDLLQFHRSEQYFDSGGDINRVQASNRGDGLSDSWAKLNDVKTKGNKMPPKLEQKCWHQSTFKRPRSAPGSVHKLRKETPPSELLRREEAKKATSKAKTRPETVQSEVRLEVSDAAEEHLLSAECAHQPHASGQKQQLQESEVIAQEQHPAEQFKYGARLALKNDGSLVLRDQAHGNLSMQVEAQAAVTTVHATEPPATLACQAEQFLSAHLSAAKQLPRAVVKTKKALRPKDVQKYVTQTLKKLRQAVDTKPDPPEEEQESCVCWKNTIWNPNVKKRYVCVGTASHEELEEKRIPRAREKIIRCPTEPEQTSPPAEEKRAKGLFQWASEIKGEVNALIANPAGGGHFKWRDINGNAAETLPDQKMRAVQKKSREVESEQLAPAKQPQALHDSWPPQRHEIQMYQLEWQQPPRAKQPPSVEAAIQRARAQQPVGSNSRPATPSASGNLSAAEMRPNTISRTQHRRPQPGTRPHSATSSATTLSPDEDPLLLEAWLAVCDSTAPSRPQSATNLRPKSASYSRPQSATHSCPKVAGEGGTSPALPYPQPGADSHSQLTPTSSSRAQSAMQHHSPPQSTTQPSRSHSAVQLSRPKSAVSQTAAPGHRRS